MCNLNAEPLHDPMPTNRRSKLVECRLLHGEKRSIYARVHELTEFLPALKYLRFALFQKGPRLHFES
jgi:hypothetical protein